MKQSSELAQARELGLEQQSEPAQAQGPEQGQQAEPVQAREPRPEQQTGLLQWTSLARARELEHRSVRARGPEQRPEPVQAHSAFGLAVA